MPTYQISQYELHSAKYRIEADSEDEAIARFFEGEGDPVNDSLEFIETANDHGMPSDEYPSLVRALRKQGIDADDCIPSIRSIDLVWPRSPQTSPAACTCRDKACPSSNTDAGVSSVA